MHSGMRSGRWIRAWRWSASKHSSSICSFRSFPRELPVCSVCGQPCKRSSFPPDGEVVYVGDGYSDRCGALAADRVFARRGLATYLDEQGVAYEPFDDLHTVAAALS